MVTQANFAVNRRGWGGGARESLDEDLKKYWRMIQYA